MRIFSHLLGKSERLSNQAIEYWRQRQRLLLQGNDGQAEEACVEVIRLCQQAILANQKNGDSYVLLANALLSLSLHGSMRSDPERYEFLLSRAAAVIHLWHSLQHGGYPITKNTAVGDHVWRITLDEVMKYKTLASVETAVALMDSYRDSLSAETIAPDSFEEIKKIVSQRVTPPGEHWSGLEGRSLL